MSFKSIHYGDNAYVFSWISKYNHPALKERDFVPEDTTTELKAKEEIDIKTEIKESIDHHIQDSYDFIFLSDTEKNEWVRFKMDEKIRHVLLDEAQDTDNDQWHILKALVDEF